MIESLGCYARYNERTLGFSEICITWILALYRNAQASVIINNTWGPMMELQRSMRQGCPLAPYLFLLTVDVLGHMLQDPTHGILAMFLPNGPQSTSQMFTNDTTFYLAWSKEDIETTMAMLHKFGAASGIKVNLTKYVAVWVLPKEKGRSCGEVDGLRWQKFFSWRQNFSN